MNVDKEIQDATKQLKIQEATVKKTGETIEWATKKNAEATAKVTELQASLLKLKGEKEKFLLAQGAAVNSFDTFFEGEEWANLRANATVGTEALDLMEK